MKVRLTAPARRDLYEIGDWIARDSVRNALAQVDRLEAACLSLAKLPRRWPVVTRSGLRRRPEGSYLIFYRVTDQVEIIRVIHGSRDWPRLLDHPE